MTLKRKKSRAEEQAEVRKEKSKVGQ